MCMCLNLCTCVSFSVCEQIEFMIVLQIASIKIIRNKQTGLSEGYGFVEFFSHATADKVLQSYSAMPMPNIDQPFRLNWASFSTGEKRSDNNASDLSIFVGDLAADVTDSLLLETFSSKYPSVKAAKVVFDANTGRSKGYGFVRFGDDNERSQAMSEMNGVYCSSRPMRIGAATPRKSSGYHNGHYLLYMLFLYLLIFIISHFYLVSLLILLISLMSLSSFALIWLDFFRRVCIKWCINTRLPI